MQIAAVTETLTELSISKKRITGARKHNNITLPKVVRVLESTNWG